MSASVDEDICFDCAVSAARFVHLYRDGPDCALSMSRHPAFRKGAGTTGPGLKVLTGINHLLHTPGTADNDAVLAPSVVAALVAWAQPFAAAG
jgi:hypothetical protein